jgi:hypothetical protein
MQNEDYSPDEMDIDSLAVPVQDFSYGGPVESSGERQESMDDFENQFELYKMAKGGLAEANIYNLSDEEDEAINTDPVGASQKLLAGLTGEQAASPTARSIKAPARKPSGGAESPKGMTLAAESLTTAKDLVPKLKDKGSARQQMEELARVYQLKIRAAQDKSKGLAADTFGAPTLEQPTLTKNTLAKKRFATGGLVAKALKGTKAVDEAGAPITAYRGEYGPSPDVSSQLGSLSFGSKEAANLYARDPNRMGDVVQTSKVFPAQLSIRKPLINTPDDPFIDLGALKKALGQKEFDRVVKQNAARIENTGAFDELASSKGYTSVADLMKKDPKALDKLYMEVFPVLDDPKSVKALQKRGYDGAIYGGSGANALEPEYRVFSASQAVSPLSRTPLAPRSTGQRISDFARDMDLSPTDILGFFGKAAGAAGTALTPSALNKGEAEELARRRTLPPTIDRANGSPKGGEAKKPEAMAEPTLIESSPATRTFLNVLGGRREPLTEKDFTPSEHAAMLEVIRTSEARGKSPKGRVDYGDYPSAENAGPGYKDIRNTLGGFGYQRDPEGGVTISDKYDFHGPRVAEYEKMGGIEKAASTAKNALLEFLKQGGPRDLAGEIGRAYIGTKGPDIKIRIPPPVKRAKGSPEEGELTQEEIDAASKPAFVTPKSGIGRKEGPISEALRSGEAYVSMAKGLTEMPYNLAGAPMDLTMLARQALTGQAPAGQVGTSDYIKRKATELGIRPAPPADPTQKGFYTAGDLLSNLVNPAALPRKVGPAIEKGVKAGATEVARQLDRAVMDSAGPLAALVPQAAKPMYAVRPTGSMTNAGRIDTDPLRTELGIQGVSSNIENLLTSGIQGQGVDRTTQGMEDFWNKKARNYFEKQFGTPNDPIADALKEGRIKGPAVQDIKAFPSYLTDPLSVGKTRTREGARPEAGFVGPGAPETRFFPKYPQAQEEFTSRYDTATGLRGSLVTAEPGLTHLEYSNIPSTAGSQRVSEAKDRATEALATQGVREELANPNIELVARSEKDPTRVVGGSKRLLEEYEKASAGKPSILPPAVLTAIQKGEPIYDITQMSAPLKGLFNPAKINQYLETLPERELANVRFEDVIQGTNKMFADVDAFRALDERIRSGKNVPDKVFSDGVSKPLLQFDKKSGYDGFAWKRLETPESTVPEGAYIGHSVGGYKLGGITYSKEKMQAFKDGRYQVYTLRDNRNRPVTTVEVQMIDEFTPVVMQIKGSGRATGNVPAEQYDRAVVDFFENYLHPAKIEEKEALLTPLLQTYKDGINAGFKMP